ncbi:Uncharacterised protein [uncultured archaeon]|nr:Uncharacterised protein [uncultured archaeon]
MRVQKLSEEDYRWLPKWLVSDSLPPSSRDPLGLQAGAEKLANRLLPGLTVFTYRIGYFFFLSWALRELNRKEDLRIEERLENLNRLERALVLCETVYHGKDHLKDCKHQGQRSKGHLLNQVEKKRASIPEKILKNQNNTGCYNLYRTPMRSGGFWEDDDEAASQGLIPFRLTNLGEKLANAFSKREYASDLLDWALNGKTAKSIETLAKWCESFCFCTFNRKSEKKAFLTGFLFAEGNNAEVVSDADTRQQTLRTLSNSNLLFAPASNSPEIVVVSAEGTDGDVSDLELLELGGDTSVLLHFYNNSNQKNTEFFIAAAIYEMLGLALNSIWSGLLDFIEVEGRMPLNLWVESVLRKSNSTQFWDSSLWSPEAQSQQSEDQLVGALFANNNKVDNGFMLVLKVLGRDRNRMNLREVLYDTELQALVEEAFPYNSQESVKGILPKIADLLLHRHKQVSQIKGKELWLDKDGDDVMMVDRQEMGLGFHSYRFSKLGSLARDLKLVESDLDHD